MHGAVDLALEQRGLDFFHEQPLATDFGERDVADLIAGCLDPHDLYFESGERAPHQVDDPTGLCDRQRAAASAYANLHDSSESSS